MHPFVLPRLSSVLRSALVLFIVTSVRAQWSGTPSINNPVIVNTSIIPQAPVMVSDGAGGALFVWRDDRNGSGNFDIYAQRLDANGARVWGDNGTAVTNVPGNASSGYSIIADGTGGGLLVWRDDRPVNGLPTKNVWVQRLDASGQAQWGANGLLLRADADLAGAGVGHPFFDDGVGGCYVITGPDGGSDNAHRVHRLTSAGVVAPGWPAGGVDLQQTGRPVAVVTDQPSNVTGEHGFMIAMSIGGGITLRRVAANGSVGAALGIPTYFGLYSFQGASSDGAGGMFIVTGINADLFIFRALANGTLAWPETDKRVALLGGANNSGSTPVDVMPDGAGGAIVTWFGPSPGTPTLYRMAAQRLSPTGARLWGDNGVDANTPAANIYYPGTSISDGAGGVIVTWGLTTPSEVRAQRLDATGNKLWPAAGVLISQPWGLTQLVSDQASGAIYSIRASANGGNSTLFGAKRTTLTGTLGSNTPSARLANISARAQIGTEGNVLIPGFVVSGGPVKLLVRGVGPTLAGAPFNVAGTIADPVFTLFNSSNVVTANNDNWSATPGAAEITTVASQVGAFSLPNGSNDAAVVVTLSPGSYTAVTSGVNSTTGVGLVELYEAPAGVGGGRLVNLSVRAVVGTGANILIPGLVIGGSGARSLLIRAVGPTLGVAPFNVPGTLADPQLAIFSGSNQLGVNDNWSSPNGAQISAIASQVGAFPLPTSSKDAALLVTLGVGAYTVQVSGVGNTTGVCLVEVYEIP